jgi:hypothetical protein
MVKLRAGNCQLKPSQRRQLLAWLKRAINLGEKVGNFLLDITVRRVGRCFEMQASVHDAAGDFQCRIKGQTWRDVCRWIARTIAVKVHAQRLALAPA